MRFEINLVYFDDVYIRSKTDLVYSWWEVKIIITSISIVNEKIHTLMAFYDNLEFQCDPLLINSYAFGYLILQNS